MAEVVGSGGHGNSGYWIYTWADLANGDTGRPVAQSRFADKTVTVNGTFSTGGEVTMQGSMDGTTWFTLTTADGSDLVLTAAGGALIVENPRYIRPNVTGGDGSTEVDISIGAGASA